MPQLLNFSRNRSTSVEQVDATTLRSVCLLQDTLTEASVELLVTLPDLEISDCRGSFRRTPDGSCVPVEEALRRAVGIRVGPGMLKIIRGLVGEVSPCEELAVMIEECCHGVILSLTTGVLRQAPKDEEGIKAFFVSMVQNNPRLYNRCAAFASGSMLVENLDLTGISFKDEAGK